MVDICEDLRRCHQLDMGTMSAVSREALEGPEDKEIQRQLLQRFHLSLEQLVNNLLLCYHTHTHV